MYVCMYVLKKYMMSLFPAMGVELGVACIVVSAFCRMLDALWFVGSKTCIELEIVVVKKKRSCNSGTRTQYVCVTSATPLSTVPF